MTTYVYQVTNRINSKVYIGKTVDVESRWKDHIRAAKQGCPYYFHRALRKYGNEAFSATVLAAYATDAEASAEEARLIDATPSHLRYNTAPGGTGGHTMSPEQLDQQYTIKAKDYPRVRELFESGITARGIAEDLQVPLKAVRSCAKRIGISFQGRRHAASIRPKPKRRCQYTSKRNYTDEQLSQRRSEVLRRNNINRGTPVTVQAEIWHLYTVEHLTAKQVADCLGVSQGVVRGTINRWYANLSDDARVQLKHAHGSIVRTGNRNPNARKKVQP